MDFPLTNITHPTLQHMNRSEGNSFEADLCSPITAPSGGGSPVYGPTVSTQHEQFINVGPVDPNGAGQRKNQGQRNKSSNNNSRKSSVHHSRGLSPTNSQPIHQSRSQHHMDMMAPIGSMMDSGMMDSGMMMDSHSQMFNQMQMPQQQQQLTSAMSDDELEHQRLEEFAALQQQLQMTQYSYSNEAMMSYFHQMGMQMPLHMLQQGGGGMSGSPMHSHSPHHQHTTGGNSQLPMHNGGFTMPPADRMAALDYHQMMLQQQQGGEQQSQMLGDIEQQIHQAQAQQQLQEYPRREMKQHATPNKREKGTPAGPRAIATPSTPESRHHHKNGSPSVSTEDPCPCIHCHQAKQMRTPSENHGASPEDYTPHHSSTQGRSYNTPTHRQTNQLGDRQPNSGSRYSTERRGPSKQERRPNSNNTCQQGQSRNEASQQLFAPSAPPTGTPKFKVQISGHFGRKFHIKSAIQICKGDHVIFDGDRGLELGEVAEVTPMDMKEVKRIESTSTQGAHPGGHTNQRRGSELLHRLATDAEVFRWNTVLMEDAEEATKAAQALVIEHNLRLVIRCGSYQFDGKKLTFFYESEGRIDFRKLLSEMFSRFHCRIWMEQTSELAFVPQ